MRNLSISLTVLFLILISFRSDRLMYVNDGFETDSLSNIWSSDKFLPGALRFQTKYVRSGYKAAMLTLHSGDQIEEGKGNPDFLSTFRDQIQ